MCLAIPGKVVSIEGQQATVEYPGQQRKVMVGGEKVAVGNYVLVQMGIIIKVVSEEEAQASLKAWTS